MTMRFEFEIGWRLFALGMFAAFAIYAWVGRRKPPSGGAPGNGERYSGGGQFQ
jgi:hypothetical protein